MKKRRRVQRSGKGFDPERAKNHQGRRSKAFMRRRGERTPMGWGPSREQVLTALARHDEPIGGGHLATEMHITDGDGVRAVIRVLRELKTEGEVMEPRPGRYLITGAGGEFPVVVEQHGAGFKARFSEQRILDVHPRHSLGCRDGDRAVAMINERGQALLTRLVHRCGRQVSGSLIFLHNKPVFVPDNRREGELRVLGSYKELARNYQAGDRVIGEIERDGSDVAVRLVGTLSEDSPELADYTQVVLSYDLPGDFPLQVQTEADNAVATFSSAGREDLRDAFIFTIDPETAKDFDDAISLEPLPDGGWRLGVHIADVSHFVSQGSALDAEATSRGTSIYLINRVIPMLPERLSNGLCSLKPGEDRYALSVFLDLDQRLRLVACRPAETLIRSQHRLSYQQALAIIEGRAAADEYPPELTDAIDRCHRVAQGLRRQRVKDGAINLYAVEHEFALDVEGSPIEVAQSTGDVAHQLIEEFMLLANRAVAAWLSERGRACVYRVHGEPDEDRLAFFASILDAYGLRGHDVYTRFGLQQVLDRLADEPDTSRLVLNFMCLRCFQKAIYSVKNIGHHALAFSHYLHFTSPIRRYPDLLVHRLVKRELGIPAYQGAEHRIAHLDALARQCSYLEQRAESAERDLRQIKAARYLATRLGDTFAGVVTGVARHGLYVQLLETGLDGLIPMRQLHDDYYQYDPDRQCLIGRDTGRVLGIGHECEVQVVSADIPRGEVDLAFV